MTDWIYPFPPLQGGTLLKRYKRFFADIELDSGEIITAHCPNTGPMTGVCHLGGRVMVSHNPSPKRKLAYTWELAAVQDTVPTWVGANTALPNRVIKAALKDRVIPEVGPYTDLRTEVPYGRDRKSRIDFLLSTAEQPDIPDTYVEVKNTTWAQGTLVLFPDTVTTRGQKHLRELTELQGTAAAVMLYFINRGDCDRFAPGDEADPEYGQLLRSAIAAGVRVLPCRFDVQPTGIRYLGLAELVLG
ncbi:DNA/RNA nuclease SfsA [Leptolyngbya sp. PCC 6406]|uniref:DNA/RNA nuclease SfsA n=1 Tax=Leptolyngbya sp. PCC 6406 TaxID=1173264 RepID=UPI0002EB950D|nr:DNA/RNA nuclease SfsA [Leptolyngbya sp. PCC 6406]